VHAARDISALRHAEAVVRRSEQRLRDITSSMGEGVLVVDRAGAVTFMNPEAERLLGWTHEELAGRSLHELAHGKRANGGDLRAEDCPLLRVVHEGEPFASRDEVFSSKFERMFPVSVVSAALREDGQIVGAVMAFRDISDEKRAEAEREALVQELQTALGEIRTLRGILPICSYCNKIRDDQGAWRRLEAYISEHTDARFSHGMCLDCEHKFFPEPGGPEVGRSS
jgi:PAS domain S-box-containing protein